MTILEMIAEWRKGCPCSVPDHPETCHSCTVALIESIERKEQPKGVKCHGDACCAGQKPCPTPNACGVTVDTSRAAFEAMDCKLIKQEKSGHGPMAQNSIDYYMTGDGRTVVHSHAMGGESFTITIKNS